MGQFVIQPEYTLESLADDTVLAVFNHLLFSEIFFRQIRRETANLDNLRATLGTICDTWQYYLPPPEGWSGPTWTPPARISKDDVAELRSKIVEQIFAYLELTYGPCDSDERAFFLYGDWGKQECTGLCLVVPYSADVEGRDAKTGIIPKGRNCAQQLIRLLRQHDLDWGVLTNGRHWRLFHRTELSPTDTYLHIDLEQIIASDDIQNCTATAKFHLQGRFAGFAVNGHIPLLFQFFETAARVVAKTVLHAKSELCFAKPRVLFVKLGLVKLLESL